MLEFLYKEENRHLLRRPGTHCFFSIKYRSESASASSSRTDSENRDGKKGTNANISVVEPPCDICHGHLQTHLLHVYQSAGVAPPPSSRRIEGHVPVFYHRGRVKVRRRIRSTSPPALRGDLLYLSRCVGMEGHNYRVEFRRGEQHIADFFFPSRRNPGAMCIPLSQLLGSNFPDGLVDIDLWLDHPPDNKRMAFAKSLPEAVFSLQYMMRDDRWRKDDIVRLKRAAKSRPT